MTKFTILLSGELTLTNRVKNQIAYSFVIAADNGIKHAHVLGVVPQLWIGDFDSCNQMKDYSQYASVAIQKYDRDKDKADGALAIEEALNRGAEEIVLIGAFGGPRADHIFGHISQAVKLSSFGKKILLTSGYCEAIPLFEQQKARFMSFDYKPGTNFSILAFDRLEGLTIEGSKWPLTDYELAFGVTLSLSNEVKDHLKIGLRKGRGLLWAGPL